MRRAPAWLTVTLLAAPALAAEPAAEPPAEPQGPPPFSFGPVPGYSLLGGLQGGGSFGSGDAGGYLGLDLSYNRLKAGTWVGASADASWDFGRDELLACLGPQLGLMAVGLDAGGALRLRDGETTLGVEGRLAFTVGVFAVTGRYAHFFDGDPHLFQVGILLKLPLWASDTGDLP